MALSSARSAVSAMRQRSWPDSHIRRIKRFIRRTEQPRDFVNQAITAVRSTNIFCRAGCPAPSPLPGNVDRLASAREALFAGYRPCLRCRPLDDRQAATHACRAAPGGSPAAAAARRAGDATPEERRDVGGGDHAAQPAGQPAGRRHRRRHLPAGVHRPADAAHPAGRPRPAPATPGRRRTARVARAAAGAAGRLLRRPPRGIRPRRWSRRARPSRSGSGPRCGRSRPAARSATRRWPRGRGGRVRSAPPARPTAPTGSRW